MNIKDNNDFVDFGYNFVERNKKSSMVFNVFRSVSTKYDFMNDLMSFGIHRIWKCMLIKYSGVSYGHKVLDVAGGTGDLTVKFVNLVGTQGMVVLADNNNYMLQEGRRKLRNLGLLSNIYYVQSNAEMLPFKDEVFDCVVISFGLRNITEKEQALRSMHRVLKYGGKLLILEFSKPLYILLNKLYNFYSFYILPKLGKLIVNDEYSYRYLVESIRIHPDQDMLKNMMKKNGFSKIKYFNMTGGIVAVHYGYKL
ncbi:bifunctional demethylmenaquinone methyltransferase/2-methoxy-6-polyprenyl-1,4-benzoquinol methylase UbiE [Blochmannia endosymbiont of Camponotus (Colobopsis) obliquus]|uniref:bifunctional demethylmenaquinone methyltransferase/2-methoxy-6-polyprenyl-1,4-benzoquinol methylase UbiE n=1 Tax=Blochmannia endosymbiont of Camponotus (Colobopsis) obliquus TaxID=1505597 RepID=UPI00061A5B53|nr:bifunctional demethylmenaquinone methyltransferase/2-methoxy-6-polyprenyl-1,4-benzoquinol methylase UbiE [Blochmannia endosymbiont of Camponotus (Colobopsis) obliquus]AKC60763.1 ubiquinone/menaquinone biosynthesis methyltransferase ubiE [Blochmannia endosymbiont of Camponotus (Colobopsis) obliquus]